MTIEIGIALGIAAVAISAASYFGGKQAAAKKDGAKDGEWRGRLSTTLEHVKTALDEIRADLKAERQSRKEDILAVHRRIDDHLRNDHGINVPQRG